MKFLVLALLTFALAGASYLKGEEPQEFARCRDYVERARKCFEETRKRGASADARLGGHVAEWYVRLGEYEDANRVIDAISFENAHGVSDIHAVYSQPLAELIRTKKMTELAAAKARCFAALKKHRFGEFPHTVLSEIVEESLADAYAACGQVEEAAKIHRGINQKIPAILLQRLSPEWLPPVVPPEVYWENAGNFCTSLPETEKCLDRLATVELIAKRFDDGHGQMILARFAIGAALLGRDELAQSAAILMSDIDYRKRVEKSLDSIQQIRELKGEFRKFVASGPESEQSAEIWRREQRLTLIALLESAIEHGMRTEVKRWLPKLAQKNVDDKPEDLLGIHNLQRDRWFDRTLRIARMQAETGDFHGSLKTASVFFAMHEVKADLIGHVQRAEMTTAKLEDFVSAEPSSLDRGWMWVAMARREAGMPPINAWPPYNDLVLEATSLLNM